MLQFGDLSLEEQEKFEEGRKGVEGLNSFAEYFFRLPVSGSRWWEDDEIGHFRHLFSYEFLFDFWKKLGHPDQFEVMTEAGDAFGFRYMPDDNSFLLPHGYLFMDWAKKIIPLTTHVAYVETGTGSSKTSSIAISNLCYCVLYPGFNFLNCGPTTDQSELMVEELDKWIIGSPFSKFLKPPRSHETHTKKPHARFEFRSPYNPSIVSTFECQTVGTDASGILGKGKDHICIDECSLMAGVSDAWPKLLTRMRATRADGSPRSTKITLLTNPGDNPELEQIEKKITEIQNDPNSRIKCEVIKGLNSSVNLYISRRQKDFQVSLLDHSDQLRWLEGDSSAIATGRDIPEVIIERCRSQWLESQILTLGRFSPRERDGIGLLGYDMPKEEGHAYIVTGDPGQSDAIKLSLNNIPTTAVWDVTNFLDQPTRLVSFALIDGGGKYRPWLDKFKKSLDTYGGLGFYDATSMRTSFEETHEFDNYPTTPVTFQGYEKQWAKATFVLLAENGQFAWPYIRRLWYEASIYREFGVGVKKLADDLLAAAFTFCLAVRYENTLFDKLVEKFKLNVEDLKKDETQAANFSVIQRRKQRSTRRNMRQR